MKANAEVCVIAVLLALLTILVCYIRIYVRYRFWNIRKLPLHIA